MTPNPFLYRPPRPIVAYADDPQWCTVCQRHMATVREPVCPVCADEEKRK